MNEKKPMNDIEATGDKSTTNKSDEAFIDASKRVLDEQINSQSPDLNLALFNARQQALKAQGKPKSRPSTWIGLLDRPLIPIGFATTAILVIVLWLPTPSSDLTLDNDVETLSIELLDMLSAEEDIALYEELEFINWLSSQAEQG